MKALGRAATALLLAAAVATAGASQQPQPTIQEQFDAAAAALEAENWAEALRILEALEARVAQAGNARSLAVVRVRKAQALFRLSRLDEARSILLTSLPLLPARDASLNDDRFRGYVGLGRLAELRLDYREAAANYRQAQTIAVEPALKIVLYRGLVQSLMFYEAPAALAAADEGLRLLAQVAPDARELEGQFRTSRGRVLLNMGRIAEAREELELATRRLGGLGATVNVRDIIARSDLAIAALLAGDRDEARRYLALTGAGRMREAALPSGGSLPPAHCGNGLNPSDVAVVEISIRDDGSVASASPVYASTQGDSAIAFARAALDWSWRPEEVRPIDPIFRAAIRVEMRCTLAGESILEASPAEIDEIARWAESQRLGFDRRLVLSRTRQDMEADLAAAEARSGAGSAQLIQPLLRLGGRDDIGADRRRAYLRRALQLAIGAHAPPAYTAQVALWLGGVGEDTSASDYMAVLREPGIAADPYVAAVLHLAAAYRHYREGRSDEAAALLERARAIPGLGAGHPVMRRLADLMIAVETARDNGAAAASLYRSLPAGSYSCGTAPRVRSGTGWETDFPDQALAWGFEGWTEGEAQIRADGTPVTVRTTLAYPPFVFTRASDNIVGRMRFEKAFEPETGPCATIAQRIVYRLPGS
jgi:tetratricopeptide (TPR) repeat protein